MILAPQSVALPLWHQHLVQKIAEFRSVEEAMAARQLYENGVSASRAAKMILAKRSLPEKMN